MTAILSLCLFRKRKPTWTSRKSTKKLKTFWILWNWTCDFRPVQLKESLKSYLIPFARTCFLIVVLVIFQLIQPMFLFMMKLFYTWNTFNYNLETFPSLTMMADWRSSFHWNDLVIPWRTLLPSIIWFPNARAQINSHVWSCKCEQNTSCNHRGIYSFSLK